jgi:cobaltochelatase CobS
MALIKHDYPGVRTTRKPCNNCKSTDLYWAHDDDTSARQGKYACDKTECPGNGSFNWTHINRDGSRHDCQGKAGQAHSEPEHAEATTEINEPPALEGFYTRPEPTAPVTAPAGADPRFAQLASLLGELTTATVDATQVHAIVDERLRGLVLPVQVEIKRDGVVRKVEGLAHKVLATVIKRMQRKHVLMVGPAGTGKSHIAHQAADALGFEFYSISLTPQTPASAITGYMTATGEYIGTAFRQAFEHGGVFLFDEADNGHPSTLGIINSALANGSMAFPDGMVKRHADFRCVASANTYGRGPDRAYVGRQALDAAFLDRFTVLTVDVDEALEEALCLATGLDGVRVKAALAYVRHLRARAYEYKMPLVFSPRRSESMCDALADGFTVAEAVEMEIRRGISDADWRKVADGAPRI